MLTGKFSTKIDSYRPDIDGLRAIAVLLVLGYHVFPDYIKGGFIGVDVFFVISGYLISGIILDGLKDGSFTFSGFFARRIKRIYPALTLVLLTSYILGWLILMPKEFKELNKHILGGVSFSANFTLWHDSGYFDALPELKPLLHLWSLGIEEQFYFLWPLGLFLAWKYRIRMMPVVILVIILSFILNIVNIKTRPEAVFYFPFTRFWELLIGAALVLYNRSKLINLSHLSENFLSVSGMLLIVVASYKLNKHSFFPGWWAALPALGGAFLIAGKHSWLNSKILSNRFFVWVGLISYPLYLWHWIIISYFYYGVGSLPFSLDRVAIIFLSFLLAWISYKFVETPIRHGKNNKVIVRNLLFVSFSIGIAGVVTFRMEGLPFRMEKIASSMPKEIREMINPDFGGNVAADWREHSCFLAKGETSEKFQSECTDANKKPLVFIWGDSHAAALYSGLKAFQNKKNFGIAQFTASACPPILNWEGNINKFCREINDHNIELIRKLKPDVVILQATWGWDEYNVRAITGTLEELKRIDIGKIILTGESPAWKEKVPANIISYYKKFGRPPSGRTDFGLVESAKTLKIDRELSETSKKFGISFISIYRTLCDDRGCLLNTGESITNVTSLDQGHLSKTAAEYVIETNAGMIFSN